MIDFAWRGIVRRKERGRVRVNKAPPTPQLKVSAFTHDKLSAIAKRRGIDIIDALDIVMAGLPEGNTRA